MVLSTELCQCMMGGTIWQSLRFSLVRFQKDDNNFFSCLMYDGFSPLVVRFSWRSWNMRRSYFPVIFFMVSTRIMLMLQSQRKNKYLIPLLQVTGNHLASLSAMRCCRLTILENNVLECTYNGSTGASSSRFGSNVLVDWKLFLVLLIRPQEVAMDGGV